MDKQKYFIVSFSGGKDSTALLLHLLELNEQVDEVVCCDTYKEHPAMYEHIEKIRTIVEDKGIKFTLLRSEKTFDEWMFEYEPKRRNPEAFKAKYGDVRGKSWANARNRWCTGELKIKLIDKYFKQMESEYDVIHYVGIAADEQYRLERENQKAPNKKFPLVDWGWTEQQCLEYCYALGYDWNGLYTKFKRVSCWCCPLQTLDSLRTLRKDFPDLWEQLKDMDKRTWQQFRTDYSVEDLDKRFEFEEQRLTQGKSIRNREFYKELKELLESQDNAAD